ncbi:MAG: site-2 protease family protein [Phycisphaeraceae bacterium]
MFGPRFRIATLFGLPIYIDLSWFLIALLITWSLAEGLFVHQLPVYLEAFRAAESTQQAAEALREQAGLRWIMGVVGALGLFGSVLLHELGHARAADLFGVPMKSITLFIFGGVAEMNEEPPSAKAEFWVAVAGPLVTVVLFIVGTMAWTAGLAVGLALPATTLIAYLTIVNGMLLAFNMLPAFPLDGGRVLRAAIWAYSGKLTKATRITSRIGGGFGLALIGFGLLNLLLGAIVPAIWWTLIGLFLRSAAQMSYQRVLARTALEGEALERFMNRNPITITPDLPLDQLVDDFIYRYHYKMFPIVNGDGQLQGCLTIDQIKDVPRDDWPATRVSQLMERCGPDNTIRLDQDPLDALTAMHANNKSRLMVLDDRGQLVGVVSLKDLMEFLSLKLELGDEG